MFSTYQRCGLLMMLVHHPSISLLAICLIFAAQIRQLAIEKLSDGFGLDPIEKILLAKKYRVRNWLLEGYAQLISQQAPLQMKTLDFLDCKTKVPLLSLRDRYPLQFMGIRNLTIMRDPLRPWYYVTNVNPRIMEASISLRF